MSSETLSPKKALPSMMGYFYLGKIDIGSRPFTLRSIIAIDKIARFLNKVYSKSVILP